MFSDVSKLSHDPAFHQTYLLLQCLFHPIIKVSCSRYNLVFFTYAIVFQAAGPEGAAASLPHVIAPPSSEITSLSTTIVVLQQDQIIDQKVIPTLVIPSDYITVRHDVASIMLCSLLHLITQTTPTDPTFPKHFSVSFLGEFLILVLLLSAFLLLLELVSLNLQDMDTDNWATYLA